MSKNFRNRKRKHNKKLPARYTLLIMTAVCFITMLLSLTLNISGGPLKTAAGYVFIPMQKGINSFGIHISDKVTEIRTLKNVKAENKKLKAEVEELTTQLTTTKLESESYPGPCLSFEKNTPNYLPPLHNPGNKCQACPYTPYVRFPNKMPTPALP